MRTYNSLNLRNMKAKGVLFDQMSFLDLGVTHRRLVIESLGNPEDFTFEDDYQVVYKYPSKGIEITIKIGHIHTSSVVTAISITKPYEGLAIESLEVGMSFAKALEICNREFEIKQVKKNSRIFRFGEKGQHLQIWKENDKLSQLKVYDNFMS